MRLLVLGWDGASFNHLEEIKPPFYNQLYKEILLPEPFWQNREVDSGAAWTTITTGKSMFDHKVLSIAGELENEQLFKLYSYFDKLIPRNLFGHPARIWLRSKLFYKNPPKATDINCIRIWEKIPNSLAWSVPVTHPPKPFNGVMVSGIPYPNTYGVYPKSLDSKIKKIFSGEPMRGDDIVQYKASLFEQHFREMKAIKWLYDRYEFNFAFIVFVLLDRLMHVEEDWNKIKKAYEVIDQSTKELVGYINPDEVLILSDHGMKKERRGKWEYVHDEKQGVIASTNPHLLVKNQLEVFKSVNNYLRGDGNDFSSQ